jgi:outer membrane biosynthesis protein TonB
MFSRLAGSAARRSRWRQGAPAAGVSILFHGLVLAAAVVAANRAPALVTREITPEQVTYVHVAPALNAVALEAMKPPPSMAQEPLAAQAPAPESPLGAGVRYNPTPIEPAVIQAGIAAGFKELKIPVERIGLPTPDSSQGAVSANDFRGRGVIGGAGNGRPNPIAPPGTLASGTGAGSDNTDTQPASPRIYTTNTVEVHPKLLNKAELPALLQRLYPPFLRDAGFGGDVVVEFVITAAGDVDMGTFVIVEAAADALGEASRAAVAEFRWQPARRAGRKVPMLGRMTITWAVHGP